MSKADDLIARGYRLHWVEITQRVPVLCKPAEAHALDDYDLKEWRDEDDGGIESRAWMMVSIGPEIVSALPFTTADVDGDPPTIGELAEAQKAAR